MQHPFFSKDDCSSFKRRVDTHERHGFSIIELVVTIGIIAIVSVVSLVGLSNRRGTSELENTSAQVVAVLRDARNRSVSQFSSSAWGVHFENATSTPFYSLYKGSYSTSTTEGNFPLPVSIRYSTSSLPEGNSVDILFSQLGGVPSASTTIGLELVRGGTVVASTSILVSSSGLVAY